MMILILSVGVPGLENFVQDTHALVAISATFGRIILTLAFSRYVLLPPHWMDGEKIDRWCLLGITTWDDGSVRVDWNGQPFTCCTLLPIDFKKVAVG